MGKDSSLLLLLLLLLFLLLLLLLLSSLDLSGTKWAVIGRFCGPYSKAQAACL